ncbi:hypothetical protein L873DRAFT_1806013 [Choiromyces venosus 120613-1]|uniref:Uncharacterized protein n=1 Tax=Choiromyces venosus 120613-1 TaxID=1336337 RepID=A0A3N4JUN5_9PEZI|nr:hypothetical protein L873DRAFT_1806013 [Choiromyces venosus 120613-1]
MVGSCSFSAAAHQFLSRHSSHAFTVSALLPWLDRVVITHHSTPSAVLLSSEYERGRETIKPDYLSVSPEQIPYL